MRTVLDTRKMFLRDVNPRHVIQTRRIFCDAQYKVPEATRVLTRIHMMRRLGLSQSGRKPRRLPVAQCVVLDRSLDIPLQHIIRAGVVERVLRSRAKPRPLSHVSAP